MTAGSSLQSAARELGVTGQTLTYWLRTEGAGKAWGRGPRAQPLPVTRRPEAVAVVESGPAIVVVIGALRVEVTDVALAAELVRRLR